VCSSLWTLSDYKWVVNDFKGFEWRFEFQKEKCVALFDFFWDSLISSFAR